MDTLKVQQGDTFPNTFTLFQPGSQTIPLDPTVSTVTSVTMSMYKLDGSVVILNRAVTLLAGAVARVVVAWQAGDLVEGVYYLKFLVTFTDGTKKTWPDTARQFLEVTA